MNIKTKILLKKFFSQILPQSLAYEIVGAFIEDIRNHENIPYEKIQPAGNGKTSQNIKIGNYILKVGETRRTKQIKNHHRILQPILRKQILNDSNPSENLFIEIQDEVDCDWYKNESFKKIGETMYTIYKELRDSGLVWTDIRITNIGKLKKTNKPNYTQRTYQGTSQIIQSEDSTGLIGSTQKTLNAGEYVILDTDFIFNESDLPKADLKKVLLPIYYENYEKRYQKEKSNSKDID